MKIVKKALFKLSPSSYFWFRDRVQFSKQLISGEIKQIECDNTNVQTFDDAFYFANQYIKSYQIKSEISGLIKLLQDIEPKNYIEIGTADGGTHFLIRRLCKTINTSLAIDTDIRNKLLINRITSTKYAHYITGYSNTPNTLKQVNNIFPTKSSVDVLFIDGDHSYKGVKSDFEQYHHYVRRGGYIIFHDIVEDWNQRYGRKTNKYTGGVPNFFAEIKDDYEHHIFVEDPEQDGFGIGVIVKND